MSNASLNRRQLLGRTSALLGMGLLPGSAWAQGETIRIGTLTPLTGAGGPYGPTMVKAVMAVAAQINAAGGVLGRQIEIISEDDQTNPDAGVRAARKLIDVDKVVAILGTWASSVTTAVALLGIEDVPGDRLGGRFHHASAPPGLSHPHAAQYDVAGEEIRRIRGRTRRPQGAVPDPADALRQVGV